MLAPKILLAGSDFIAPPEPRQQANTLVFGDAGQGKTTFALRFAPDPVAFLSYDRRGDHAAHRYHVEGRRIMFTRIEFPGNISKLDDAAARKIGQAGIDKTVRNFEVAVRESQKGNIRTIVLDTGTEYSEIISVAIRGRADRVKGDYGKSKDLINRQLWQLFNTAREGEANLIVLARAKAIWENNEPTGKFTFRGPEVLYDAVDWAGHIRLKKAGARQRGRVKEFEIEITKAGIEIETLGNVYDEGDWGEMGPFVYACTMNYPGSSPDDWE